MTGLPSECCGGFRAPSGELEDCGDLCPRNEHRRHRSVSQLGAFAECGMRYYLERVLGVREKPAAWTVGGKAFHYVIEELERAVLEGITRWTPGDARERFLVVFEGMVAEQEEETGVPAAEWRVANKGKETVDWWREAGADMAYDYVRENDPSTRPWHTLVLPTGQPVIEFEFLLDLPGVSVPIRGFIDHARAYPAAGGGIDIMVVDYKTGARRPPHTVQLPTYARALDHLLQPFGMRVGWGGYWMARKAELETIDLDREHRPGELEYQYAIMDRAERAGLYLAQPSPFCGGCGVRAQCPVKGDGEFPALG